MRTARRAAGLTLDALSVLLPSSPQSISAWERDRVSPTPPMRPRIAEVLDVDPWVLIGNDRTLAAYRLVKGWTQTEFGQIVGVAGGVVSQFERGIYRPTDLPRWAEVLGVPLADLDAEYLRLYP